ncbi:Probable pyrroline-5-carboxylate reductase ProC [Mycobacteroides abscessus subsp. abscessus]|nr:Probable pyrroline-5-carboxylate reductase ProC [Mycobacteroides abscessus subsp. abscessus]
MLVAMSRIAIIGGGNIGEALISGLLRAGRQAKDIVVSEKVPARARALADAYSIRISEVADAVEGADFIVVAVKPSDVESATTEIAAALAKLDAEGSERETEQVLVSVAAGVSTGFFESKLAAGAPVVRVMPNAPMLVGAGVSALAKGRFANDEQLSAVAELLESVGTVITVAESQMDTVTAHAGRHVQNRNYRWRQYRRSTHLRAAEGRAAGQGHCCLGEGTGAGQGPCRCVLHPDQRGGRRRRGRGLHRGGGQTLRRGERNDRDRRGAGEIGRRGQRAGNRAGSGIGGRRGIDELL